MTTSSFPVPYVRPAFHLCVFCGSSVGNHPSFPVIARSLGRLLAERGYGLIYGGAAVGLMGEIANASLSAGGWVEGVIPDGLFAKEVAHTGLQRLHVVDSMHKRKALMATQTSAFAAIPGGFGTLDELFEILTWAQLGIHHKPIALLNVEGYYDGLLRFLERSVEDGLVQPRTLTLLRVHTDLHAMLDDLEHAVPPDLGVSWMGPGQE